MASLSAEQDPMSILAELWNLVAGGKDALNYITLLGADPILPSNFKVGTAASVTIGAASLAALEVWRARTGREQSITLTMRDAAIAFCSEHYTEVDNKAVMQSFWSPASGHFKDKDGNWIQLHCQYPHLRDGILEILGCENEESSVKKAVASWNGAELEFACREKGLCVALVRSAQDWTEHAHAKAISTLPVIEIIKLGDAPPEPLPSDGQQPLSNVNVLDLTKVIAGPVCGRTLASYGANVMRVGAKHLPFIEPLVIDTGLGKKSTFLDLRDPTDNDKLKLLLRDADIFVQGYRPGAIAKHGFGPEEVAAKRPGIVYVNLSAYGHVGPWSSWRGFDSLVQSATGIVHEGMIDAGADRPLPLPCQALDHATGYLAAFGAMIALKRRVEEGGSWMVRVSLAQTGKWFNDLGRVEGLETKKPTRTEIAGLLQKHDSPFGIIEHVRPPETFSETQPYWSSGSVPLGSNEPRWN